MVKKTFTRILVCLVALTLASATLLAQAHKPQVAHTTSSGHVTPAKNLSSTLVKIFDNLGPSTTNYYYSLNGWVVSGTSAADFGEQWVGLPFKSTVGAHVTRLALAVGIISGTNSFNVGLYKDNGLGAPGALLTQVTAQNAPVFGFCCDLVTVNIPSTAITAGQQYWIVATSNANAPDFEGAWNFSNVFLAFDLAESGWAGSNVGDFFAGQPAGAALGTIP